MHEFNFNLVHYVQRIAWPTWKINSGIIDFFNLTFIYKGSAVYVINDKAHKISAGDVICIPSKSKRSAYTFADSTMHSFAINVKLPADQSLPLPILFHASMDEYLIDLYNQFDKAWLTHDEFQHIKLNALFMLIVCRLRELYTAPVQSDKRIERAKEFILTNYHKKIDAKMLGDMANLNPIYFGTLFKTITGQTICEYINKIRINKAKDLLNDGLSIMDTAGMCGFDNIFYFSNVFKKNIGISPSEYKRK
jgi:YesN/AraC family two-component response regulator